MYVQGTSYLKKHIKTAKQSDSQTGIKQPDSLTLPDIRQYDDKTLSDIQQSDIARHETV